MKESIAMMLIGLSNIITVFGGFFLIGLFIYGIYTLFASSLSLGLMMIGGAVVGAWPIQIVSGILKVTATSILKSIDES